MQLSRSCPGLSTDFDAMGGPLPANGQIPWHPVRLGRGFGTAAADIGKQAVVERRERGTLPLHGGKRDKTVKKKREHGGPHREE